MIADGAGSRGEFRGLASKLRVREVARVLSPLLSMESPCHALSPSLSATLPTDPVLTRRGLYLWLSGTAFLCSLPGEPGDCVAWFLETYKPDQQELFVY
jgi:hypothetical protein